MDETDQQYKVVRRYQEEVLTHEYEPRLHLDWIIACNIHHLSFITSSCESTFTHRGWILMNAHWASNRPFKNLMPGTHELIIGPDAHHSKARCTLAQKTWKTQKRQRREKDITQNPRNCLSPASHSVTDQNKGKQPQEARRRQLNLEPGWQLWFPVRSHTNILDLMVKHLHSLFSFLIIDKFHLLIN